MDNAQVIVTTSWDDGHELDSKLAAVLVDHGVAATFYVVPRSPTADRLSASALLDLAGKFEIGSHTLTHPRLTRISPTEASREISLSKSVLEQMIGQEVASFCYPYGSYRDEHVEMVRSAGFLAARTIERFCTMAPAEPLRMATTVHAARYRRDGLRLARRSRRLRQAWVTWADWSSLGRLLFEEARTQSGVFHLWGHSWEIEANNDWGRLRSLLQYLVDQEGTRFVTNGELVRGLGRPS